MWSGEQAERIARLTMTGTERIVLATDRVGKAVEGGLVGLPVLHHGGSGAFGMGKGADGPAVHDSTLRVLGFTLVLGSFSFSLNCVTVSGRSYV